MRRKKKGKDMENKNPDLGEKMNGSWLIKMGLSHGTVFSSISFLILSSLYYSLGIALSLFSILSNK